MGLVSCLDTHVLIWGVKRQANSSQHYMIERTINFIQWMENERHTILIPAPVLGEFLMKIPSDEHPAVMRLFEKRFIVSPYDAPVAALFASVWQKNGQPYRESAKNELTREEVKVDCMIVAVALANKATVLYSEDPHVQKLADGLISVRDIPKIPTQPRLVA